VLTEGQCDLLRYFDRYRVTVCNGMPLNKAVHQFVDAYNVKSPLVSSVEGIEKISFEELDIWRRLLTGYSQSEKTISNMVHGIKAANTFFHPELMSTLFKAALEIPKVNHLSSDKKADLLLKAHMIIFALVNDEDRVAGLNTEDVEDVFSLLLKLSD
ncbi:MAG: hypothetical protein KZQ82_20390, partial [Candidatus Thiodiazotropha sp. (ex Lucinoma annulata)]|nr:hypothetical protein [Candidatus Thiodiazotropha sp. (ex Lucinoma annulata)]